MQDISLNQVHCSILRKRRAASLRRLFVKGIKRMCGIAGYWGIDVFDSEKITRIKHSMNHRGPDASAHLEYEVSAKKLYLFHSRLSIIDLSERSNQPMRIGQNDLIFNGELYNYKELRKQHESKLGSFLTESDTEVFGRMWNVFGEVALDECEGMWAFSFFNHQKKTLTLGRDRFGEKPLFYYVQEKGIYFASEVKTLQVMINGKLEINESQLKRYLTNGYKSLYKAKETFFKGLLEVSSGSTLTFNPDLSSSENFYWSPNFNPIVGMTYEEAVQGTRDRLIDSLNIRLRTDVPLAFCMSGGIDSGSLISIAKRIFDYEVHGFTIMNKDERYEEAAMIQILKNELGVQHTEVYLEKDNFLAKLKNLVKQHDAPIYTLSYYTHSLLMGAVSNAGYKVSISGTGADELFTGYYDHHLAYLQSISSMTALHQSSKSYWEQNVKPFVRNPFLQDSDYFTKNPGARDHIYLNSKEFSKYLKDGWGEDFSETDYTQDLLRKRMMNEMFHEAVPVILHEDDLNAMSHSIENRSPYLDRRLFEFAYSIPTQHLIQGGRSKSVLRDAVEGILPEKVRTNTRKVGFNTPIHDVLDVHDVKVKKEILEDSPIFDIVDINKIEALLAKDHLPNSESKFLFYFLCSKYFMETF